jgi:hypothetical protein
VEIYNSANKRGFPYYVYCKDDRLSINSAIPVCVYQGVWHRVNFHRKQGTILEEPFKAVHNFDFEEKKPEQLLEQGLQEANQASIPSPTKPTVQSTPSAIFDLQEGRDDQFRQEPIPDQIRTSPLIPSRMVTTTQLDLTKLAPELIASLLEGGGGDHPKGDTSADTPP